MNQQNVGLLETNLKRLRSYLYLFMVFWTVAVCGSLWWAWSNIHEGTNRIAVFVARAHFERDRVLRAWAASHGGTYVPIDEKTPPSKFLEHIAERDIQTPSGIRLTLINPAYMMRLVHEKLSELNGVRGRITGLRPLRPENAPDEWEKKALKSLGAPAHEFHEISEVDGRKCLRFMGPMRAERGCLKCHTKGYKEGDVIGGVAITVPMGYFQQIEHSEIRSLFLSHTMIFGIGMLGIAAGIRSFNKNARDLQQAHDALAASEKKYRTLFDNSRDGVFVTTRAGEMLDANHAVFELFGFNKDEMQGMDVTGYYKDAEERIKFQQAVEMSGSVKDHPIRVYKKDGTPMDCLLTANVRIDDDGTVIGYQGIIRDITGEKRAQEELQSQAEELARSNEELQRFAYVASHDLQEPLRNVVSSVQLLERACSNNLGQDATIYIKLATDSAKRMKTLIDDLLALSRVRTQQVPRVSLDCEKILEETLSDLQTTISETGAVITHDRLPSITGVPGQIGQVLQNLLSNAIKFRGESPPQIHISVSKTPGYWQFSVTDNGIGIEKQYANTIFQVFRRLHTRTEYEGTGIGLAVSKKIVDGHGGKIWVKSHVGKGSTFHFTVPVGPKSGA
ncbi:MAG TPA: ATP-binding protein [Desulfomonilaceae bacterium]|nr:ATP-binding protein [Desulfomonilaceae bacterium]